MSEPIKVSYQTETEIDPKEGIVKCIDAVYSAKGLIMSVIRDETIRIEKPIESIPHHLGRVHASVIIAFICLSIAVFSGTMAIQCRIDRLEELLTGEQAAESIFSSQPNPQFDSATAADQCG